MFSSKKTGELILIIDVQSSIVRGTLVHMEKVATPTVLYTHNVRIPYKPRAQSGYIIKAALHAISETVTETGRFLQAIVTTANHNIPHKISKVHYVLSSPWIVSQAKTLKLTFPEPKKVNKSYILGLISDERSKLGGSNQDDIRVIEEKVFDVRLNEYSVQNWDGRKTTDLEVSFVVSVAGGRMIDRFTDNCDHLVKRGSVQFHSSLFLQHLGIGKVMSDSSSYALLHVHGELTDIAIIRSNSCIFFGSYPFGTHSIMRTIARETKTDEQSAESTLTLSEKGQLDATHAQKELSIISDMEHGWIGELRKLLMTSSVLDSLPRHIIISAHSHEDFFIKSFNAAYPDHKLQILTMESIIPFVKFDSNAEQLRLTGLYVIAIHSL
ncbi:MAG: hypothetical protein RL536_498 [Candidatus Parcubacteria bacterium]|jgi:hypothetical protein